MSTNTVNFNWILPTVGGDANIWGSPDLGLNKNLISQDSFLRRLTNTFISATPPAELQSGTMWIDSTTNPWIWNVYNSGTTTWIKIGEIDNINNTFTPVSGSGDGFEIGDLKQSSISSNHGKWLICDGSAISRATYSALDAVYFAQSYPFGDGDGATTFNIPDMRGRVGGAIGAGPGLTVRAIGTSLGEETHILIPTELPDPLTSAAPVGNFTFGQGTTTAAIQSFVTGSSGIIGNLGGNQGHNNMQPTLFAGNYFVFTGV